MQKTITYRIESQSGEWHDKYNEFTVNQGETYYILGENGIGKTTLLRKLNIYGGRKDEHYDISFQAEISRELLINFLKRAKTLNDEEILEIISDFEDRPVTISYSKLSKQQDIFNAISDKVRNKLIEKNRRNILKISREILKSAEDMVDSFEEKTNEIEDFLNREISIKEINRQVLDEKDRKARRVDYNRKIVSHYFDKVTKIKKLISEMENNEEVKMNFHELFNNSFELNYYYGENEEYRTKEKKYNSLVDGLSKEMRIGSYRRFDFEDINYELLINFVKEINVNEMIHYHDFDDEKRHLSDGETVVEIIRKSCNEEIENNFKRGLILNEPFNFLDKTRINEVKKMLSEVQGTKLISTHSPNVLGDNEVANIIIMFYLDGKRCIANLSDIKDINDTTQNIAIKDQLNSLMLNWFFEDQNRKILFVEGYRDYELWSKYLEGINVIPIGGAYHMSVAISVMNKYSDKIYCLTDNDSAGNNAAEVFEGLLNHNRNLTKFIYFGENAKFKTIEELILQRKTSPFEKYKNQREMKKSEYKKRIEDLASIIMKKIEGKG